jgi:hypothetical protein
LRQPKQAEQLEMEDPRVAALRTTLAAAQSLLRHEPPGLGIVPGSWSPDSDLDFESLVRVFIKSAGPVRAVDLSTRVPDFAQTFNKLLTFARSSGLKCEHPDWVTDAILLAAAERLDHPYPVPQSTRQKGRVKDQPEVQYLKLKEFLIQAYRLKALIAAVDGEDVSNASLARLMVTRDRYPGQLQVDKGLLDLNTKRANALSYERKLSTSRKNFLALRRANVADDARAFLHKANNELALKNLNGARLESKFSAIDDGTSNAEEKSLKRNGSLFLYRQLETPEYKWALSDTEKEKYPEWKTNFKRLFAELLVPSQQR